MSACQTCADLGRAGSCARLRCYCGHEDCWAAASFVALPPRGDVVVAPAPARPASTAWATREESTWIDKL